MAFLLGTDEDDRPTFESQAAYLKRRGPVSGWRAEGVLLNKLINQEIAEYIAMRWFGKGKQSDVWDDAVPEVINDLEAAQRIRRICEAAADIAKSVGNRTCGSAEKERYERAARTAMQIALRISDDLVRDAALRQIIDLSVKAKSLRTAEVLLRGIQAVSVREDVLNDNPILRQ